MDIESIRARLAQLANKGKKPNDIWKPSGEHEIRVLPYKNSDDPFIELHFHYELGNDSILCPKVNFGNDCIICDFCASLKSWKDENGNDKPEVLRKKDWELFKKISCKVQYYFPMVERGKESEGAKFCRVAPSNYMKLLEICADKENNEGRKDGGGTKVLTSVDDGYDITVTYKPPGKGGNTKNFPVTEFKEKKKVSKLAASKAEVATLLGSVKDISEVYPRRTSADAQKLFEKFVAGGLGEEAAKESTGDGLEKNFDKAAKEKAKVGGKSIEEAFGELMNDEG